jgi:hypothetical protein
VTIIIAPTLTGLPQPGLDWRPDRWLAMMRGEVMDLTARNPQPRGRRTATHACGDCEQPCNRDGASEHLCGNEECLSLHLPPPDVTPPARRARESGGRGAS